MHVTCYVLSNTTRNVLNYNLIKNSTYMKFCAKHDPIYYTNNYAFIAAGGCKTCS